MNNKRLLTRQRANRAPRLHGSFKPPWDCAVVGAGVVGASLALGLARRGVKVLLLDEGDVAHRASSGNFGLIWVSSKGVGAPAYAAWTRRAARAWGDFAAELQSDTDTHLSLDQRGGVHPCLTQDELRERGAMMLRMHGESGGAFRYSMLDRRQLAEVIPGLGPRVVGGSFSPLDGHVDPLTLHHALHKAFIKAGGAYAANTPVLQIAPRKGGGFRLRSTNGEFDAPRVVLAAGLANATLGPQVGLDIDVVPDRGQILVSERVQPWLKLPSLYMRQTGDGTLMFGATSDRPGMVDQTTPRALDTIARRAIAILPAVARLRVVRAFAALRVMTSDGLPIYAESRACPGAFVITCHSGVTLASLHATVVAQALSEGVIPAELSAFSLERFHEPKAA